MLALGLVFLLYQLRFLRSLKRTGRDLCLAGLVFVVGAAGFEMAQGVLRDDNGSGSTWDVFPVCEELLESGGTMWALRILLAHLLDSLPRTTTVQVAGPARSTAT